MPGRTWQLGVNVDLIRIITHLLGPAGDIHRREGYDYMHTDCGSAQATSGQYREICPRYRREMGISG